MTCFRRRRRERGKCDRTASHSSVLPPKSPASADPRGPVHRAMGAGHARLFERRALRNTQRGRRSRGCLLVVLRTTAFPLLADSFDIDVWSRITNPVAVEQWIAAPGHGPRLANLDQCGRRNALAKHERGLWSERRDLVQQIRTKWNADSGRSGTRIPEEVEYRFQEVEHEIREVERRIRRKWNIGSWDRERSSVA